MVLTPVAADGVQTIIPGWTNQSASPYSTGLESYSNTSAPLFDPPQANNYVAWTLIPDDAIGTTNHVASTHGQLSRVFIPANGSVGHLDFLFTTAGTVTVFYAGIYSATGVQLAVTAESHASISGSAITALALTAATNLTGGTFVYVFTTMTWSVQPVLAGVNYASAGGATNYAIAMANAGLTVATAPNSSDYGVQATLPASLTMSGLTGYGSKPWIGLRA